MKQLYEIYKEILSDLKEWNPTQKTDIEHDIDSIFSYPTSYNFIFELFYGDGNHRPLLKSLNKYGKLIPYDRYNHMISLYILGAYIAKLIGYTRFQLSSWDNNDRNNFLHHWLAVCLFHDIGYAIEQNHQNVNEVNDLSAFADKFELKYRFHENVKTTLISNYYKYRIENCKKVDHGIAAAMIMYNLLMSYDARMEDISKTAIIISKKPLFGDENRNNIMIYSETIARHNMWFASENQKEKYIEKNLSELIPKKDNTHRISFINQPLLFLLCLLDSIEPLKIYCCQSSHDSICILKSIRISVDQNDSTLRLMLMIGDDKIQQKASSLANWLNLSYSKYKDQIEITFDI